MALVAPSLWAYEMANLLRSALRRKRLDRESVLEAHAVLSQVPVRQLDVPDERSRERILELAIEHSLSAYDAAYLELALRLKVPLLSNDAHLRELAGELGLR